MLRLTPQKASRIALPLDLIAHMDTSPDAPAVNIKPQIIQVETGDVLLNPENKSISEKTIFLRLRSMLVRK